MDKSDTYNWLRIVLHWLIAIGVIGLFVSGDWMVKLDYYDTWYTTAPYWHKSIGLLLLPLLLLATISRLLSRKPAYASSLSKREKILARIVQYSMSVLAFILVFTGYLITTANGDAVAVFNWFEIPALFDKLSTQKDISGKLHAWLGQAIIFLAILHACAALLHHFVKKDRTLLKMLGK